MAVVFAFGLVAAACSSSQEIKARNCSDVADQTMGLFQRLIDGVDSEFEDMTIEEFIASGGDLPSVDRFTQDAAQVNLIGTQLGCTQQQIQQEVLQRIDELEASTDLGRFLIDAIRTGGL